MDAMSAGRPRGHTFLALVDATIPGSIAKRKRLFGRWLFPRQTSFPEAPGYGSDKSPPIPFPCFSFLLHSFRESDLPHNAAGIPPQSVSRPPTGDFPAGPAPPAHPAKEAATVEAGG